MRTPRTANLLVILLLVSAGLVHLAAADSVTVMPSTLPSGRYDTSAVWDGVNHAYVFGGRQESTTAQIVRFTPVTGQVFVTASLPTPLFGTSAVWDGAGNAYIFGGANPGSPVSDDVIRYTPATNSVTTMSATLPSGRWATAAVWDGAGNAYIFGGLNTARLTQILRYTPSTGSMTEMPSSLPVGINTMAAIWAGNSAYIFGGETDGGTTNQIIRYTPSTGEVTVMGASLGPAVSSISAVWDNVSATASIFGGIRTGLTNAILWYVPATDTVATAPTTLPTPRHGTSAVATGASTAYVFGGAGWDPIQQIVQSIGTSGMPSAPQWLSAVRGPSAGEIRLTWQAPATDGGDAVIGYKVYRGSSSGAETPLAQVGNVWAYTDSGLPNGATRYYKVSAFNSAGEGRATATVSATTANPPTAAQGLTATGRSGQIDLAWSPPSSNGGTPVTAYKVYRGTTSGSLALVNSGSCANLGNVTSCSDQIANGVTTYYKVSAANAAGEGPQSNQASAAAGGTTPSAPRNVAASPGVGQITITWTAPTYNAATITSHKVYRGTTSGSLTLVTSGGCANPGMVLTCTDAGLGNGATRYYRVSAVSPLGEGPQSSLVSATTFTPPSAPQNVTAAGGIENVVLTWSPPTSNGGTSVTSYKIYRGTSSASLSLITSGSCSSPTGLTCTDPGRNPGTTYYYRISAANAAGIGLQSNLAPATTATSVPAAPGSLTASPGMGQITLTWTAPSNGGYLVTAYNVYRGTASGSLSRITGGGCANLGAVLSCVDADLPHGTTRYYRVNAINALGEGPSSSQASATTGTPVAPSVPQGLAASPVAGQVTLTWTTPSNSGGYSVSAYRVYRGISSGNEVLLVNGGCANLGDVLTCTDGGLGNGVTRFYKVSAVNAVGESTKSTSVSATTPDLPAAPIGLSAYAVSGDAIALAWSAPSNDGGSPVTGYAIYRGTASGALFRVTEVGNVLAHSDRSLPGNERFYYRVAAITAAGEGPQSNEASDITPVPPRIPEYLRAKSEPATTAPGRIKLTWLLNEIEATEGEAPKNFLIYRGTISGSETLLTTAGPALSYSDDTCPAPTPCYYQIAASNGAGSSGRSNQASGGVAPMTNTPPAIPGVWGPEHLRPNAYGFGYSESGTYRFSASDPDGDTITITVDWGDGTGDSGGASYQTSESWYGEGKFCVKAYATDENGVRSPWSNCFWVTVGHRPPFKPTVVGPTAPPEYESTTYSVTATDPDGHSMEVTLDMGDGRQYLWPSVASGQTANANHWWEPGGPYCVRARAKDIGGAVGDWADCLYVTVSAVPNAAPGAPTITGPTAPPAGAQVTYYASATDGDGDGLQYSFDWGDGTQMGTEQVPSGSQAAAVHKYGAQGRYCVTAYAADHRSAGPVSPCYWVDVSPANLPPGTPATPEGPSSGAPGAAIQYKTLASDPNGDQVKFTFDWGDGTPAQTTGLVASGTFGSMSHAWTRDGSFCVRAYATDSKGLSGGSTGCKTVTITTPPGAPRNPSAVATSGGQVTLTWSPPDDGTSTTGFRIYAGTSPTTLQAVGETTGSTLSFVEQGIVLVGPRHYRVNAIYNGVEGPPSPTTSVNVYHVFDIELKAWIPGSTIIDPIPEDFCEGIYNYECVGSWDGDDCHGDWTPDHVDGWFTGDAHVDYDGGFRVRSNVQFAWNGATMTGISDPGGAKYGMTVQWREYSRMDIHGNQGYTERCIRDQETTDRLVEVSASGATFQLHYHSKNPISDDYVPPPEWAFGWVTPAIDGTLDGEVFPDGGIQLQYQTDEFPSQALRVAKNGLPLLTFTFNDATCVNHWDADEVKGKLESMGQQGSIYIHPTMAPDTTWSSRSACE